MLHVHEVFDSIQGEGMFTGLPATFVRLQGCNLRCPWCDTKTSWGEGDGETDFWIEPVELAKQLAIRTTGVVVLTGGEPTLQWQEMAQVIRRYRHEGYHHKEFHLETNGTIAAPDLHLLDHIVVSPKPPDYSINIERIDELKFVIDGVEALQKAADIGRRHNRIPVSLQPESNKVELVELIVDTLIKGGMPNMGAAKWRLSLQLHKIVGVQ